MKYHILSALLASSSAIGINGQKNEHLEATYILNDAVASVESIGQKAYQEEQITNEDYKKELKRKVGILNKEWDHVGKAQELAKEMMRTPEQIEKDRIAKIKADKDQATSDKANVKKASELKKA
jgi:hypothetical protein